MSWRARPGAPAPAAAPQPFGNQQSMYPNYSPNNTTSQAQQQYWQPPQPTQPTQYAQQYAQVYQPADYGTNNAQYQQFNQNYTNQAYNTNTQGYSQNYLANQPAPSNYLQPVQNQLPQNQPTKNKDDWGDWDWDRGWDDSKQGQAPPPQQQAPPQTHPPPAHHPPPPVNNANVIEESFASTNSWNWAAEDKSAPLPPSAELPPTQYHEPAALPVESPPLQELSHENSNLRSASNMSTQSVSEEVTTLNDKEIVKERLPNLALGKRFHLDNLTPQWSIESQMSQESSDGVQTHSESTYMSENQSRNSNSSPGLNVEHYNLHALEESSSQNHDWSRHSTDDLTLTDNTQKNEMPEDQVEITNSLQEMNLSGRGSADAESTEHELHQEPTGEAPENWVPTPVGLPPAAAPPPITSNANVPPSLPAGSQNPFKNAGPLSHKSTTKVPSSGASSTNQFAPPPIFDDSSVKLSSPAAVSKIQHGRSALGFGANLETTPDNSERPDQPPPAPRRSPAPPPPDNLEVAPRSDRNEYLQTAHLSSGDYGENTDFSRNIPPPGLRRMVVGQQESEYGPAQGEEPPPGLARMVPGQHTEPPAGGARPYGQADGQPARRPPAPPPAPYARYGARPPDVRDQHMDGSDYTEPAPRSARVAAADPPADLAPPAEPPRQRDLTVEGENLQDLSVISSAELTFSREATLEGADVDVSNDRKTDVSDSLEMPASSSRRQSRNHTSEEESERNRTYDTSPRRERDKRRSSRDEGRAWARDERPRGSERRARAGAGAGAGAGAASPERRGGRGPRASERRYDTEDTDYYSDRERDSRRYREGSYAGRPPRAGEGRRGGTLERRRDRDRERERERERERGRERDEPRRERRDRHERRYRDIDPTRRHATRPRDHDDDPRRRVVTFSSDTPGGVTPAVRAGGEGSPAREPPRTDDEAPRRRAERRARPARHDPYYDEYGGAAYADPYQEARRRYQYYEHLRRTDPPRYMRLYEQLMAEHGALAALPGAAPYALHDDRASLHSASSANITHGTHTYYAEARGAGAARGGRSETNCTDLSDRDFNTDASLTLHLDESTVRSERMTPFKFSTAHVKGTLSARGLVVVAAAYPVDGRPARVLLLDATRDDARHAALRHYPGPLRHGVTHKKTLVEFCAGRARAAADPAERGPDPAGRALLWDLLALMLTQNGTVGGAELAELLMQNQRQFQHRAPAARAASSHRTDSRRGSSSVSERSREPSPSPPLDRTPAAPAPNEREALQRLRDCLLTGDQHQALELAMSAGLWGHALSLAASLPHRARAAVHARFLAALSPRDPLHTLHAARAARPPPAATCCADPRWADWRPHAAILLANPTARRDLDTRALTLFGDSLSSRGLVFSAQFCYLGAGLRPARHPLAPLGAHPAPASPPRVALLLADPRAPSLPALATDEAIFATEIYEYALSMAGAPPIPDFQVYKLLLALRLVDAGAGARAQAYCEQLRDVTRREPAHYAPALTAAAALLADRLKYHDPLLAAGADEQAPWLEPVGGDLPSPTASLSAHSTPLHARDPLPALYDAPPGPYDSLPPVYDAQHGAYESQPAPREPPQPPLYEPQQPGYDWHQPHQQPQLNEVQPPAPETAPAPAPADAPDYPQQQQQQQQQQYYEQQQQQGYGEQSYGEQYSSWQGDQSYGYGEEPPRSISMPGAATPARPALYSDYDEPHHDRQPPPAHTENSEEPSGGAKGRAEESRGKEGDGKGSGWLGGILTKLSLRAPNQMILPDDKNPTIVWDPDNKRWKNLDGGEEEERPPPPPPRAAPALSPPAGEGGPPAGGPPGSGGPPAAAPPSTNLLRMQKGRLKNSYVDVFNPSGRPPAAAPAPAPAPPAAPPAAPPHYFVPSATGPGNGGEPMWTQ